MKQHTKRSPGRPRLEPPREETRITIRFPPELVRELRTFLEQDDRSLNAEVVQAVREFLARKKMM